jgi:hypothetical protein
MIARLRSGVDARGRAVHFGGKARPATVREQAFVRRVWGRYTTHHAARYLRGGRCRLYQIAAALGLPALPLGPRP